MLNTNRIRLQAYGKLNIFLPPVKRYRAFQYRIKGNPSIKDTLEAVGIPHPEINIILVNGKSVGFSYLIKEQVHVQVYPHDYEASDKNTKILQPKISRYPKFICDVHLGKLAHHLRLLGFDTLYNKKFDDHHIAKLSDVEKRITLTRDKGLLKHKKIVLGYFVRQYYPKKQFREVVKRYNLQYADRAFTLCLECNHRIKRVSRAEIIDTLPEKVKNYYKIFYRCQGCRKVYWKGTHYVELKKLCRKLMREM